MRTSLFYSLRQLKPALRKRRSTIRSFADKLGFAYLGTMHQHDDEYDPIRGFTASTSHRDTHYAVGSYEGFDIRIVDRFDVQKTHSRKHGQPQSWTILEFTLEVRDIPHTIFVPTGKNSADYERVFSANIHMQPLNSILQRTNHSARLYGRYQILARPTHSRSVESLLTSPIIFGIGEKLWPFGLELDNNTLDIYRSTSRITEEQLSAACISGMWLANEINRSPITSP